MPEGKGTYGSKKGRPPKKKSTKSDTVFTGYKKGPSKLKKKK